MVKRIEVNFVPEEGFFSDLLPGATHLCTATEAQKIHHAKDLQGESEVAY